VTSVLVTGAGGFIGRRVLCAANSAGYGVTRIVRNSQLDGRRTVIKQDLRLPLSKLPPVAAEVYGDVCGMRWRETPTQRNSNCRVVILRIGEVYRHDGRLRSGLTARLKRGFCPWPGRGDVPLSFVHLDDVAQTFLCAVQSAPAGISVYNVTDDMPTIWLDFLVRVARLPRSGAPVFLPETLIHLYAACGTLACRAIGREPILTRQVVRLITTPKALSNTRLKRELGFQPRDPSDSEGLEEALRGVPHHT
jgi:nucleoside-diphosphate-sugar epimerase